MGNKQETLQRDNPSHNDNPSQTKRHTLNVRLLTLLQMNAAVWSREQGISTHGCHTHLFCQICHCVDKGECWGRDVIIVCHFLHKLFAGLVECKVGPSVGTIVPGSQIFAS